MQNYRRHAAVSIPDVRYCHFPMMNMEGINVQTIKKKSNLILKYHKIFRCQLFHIGTQKDTVPK